MQLREINNGGASPYEHSTYPIRIQLFSTLCAVVDLPIHIIDITDMELPIMYLNWPQVNFS